jgi:hypothetical protein
MASDLVNEAIFSTCSAAIYLFQALACLETPSSLLVFLPASNDFDGLGGSYIPLCLMNWLLQLSPGSSNRETEHNCPIKQQKKKTE